MENTHTYRNAEKSKRVAAKAEKMATLRKLATEQVECKRPVHVNILAQLSEIATVFILPKQRLNTSMCKYYGHVIDRENWGKGLPNCHDCGVVIKSKDELRGSNARA